jgi:membrane protein required for colicin V production
MIIDIVFALAFLAAVFRGFRFGLVFSIFWLLSFVIGIMAGLRFSSVTAGYLQEWFNIREEYLPLVSFLLTILLAILLFRLIGKAIDGLFRMVKLSFLNKLAGGVVWGLITALLFSCILWYGNNMELFSEKLKADSVVYEVLVGFAPATMDLIGKLVPHAADLFHDLQEWFDKVPGQPPPVTFPEV